MKSGPFIWQSRIRFADTDASDHFGNDVLAEHHLARLIVTEQATALHRVWNRKAAQLEQRWRKIYRFG